MRSNAAYQVKYRQLATRGKRPAGARIPIGNAYRYLRALTAEYGSKAAVARALGYRNNHLQLRGSRLTRRNIARIVRLYRNAADIPLPDSNLPAA